MPYKSKKQEKYFNWALANHKPGFTKSMVNEWNESSKGLKLPKFAKTKKALKGK